MFQDYYHGNAWLDLPLIALVFAFSMFALVLGKVLFGMRDQRTNEALASLPLDEGDRPEPQQERNHE